jgi:hypothetical protein
VLRRLPDRSTRRSVRLADHGPFAVALALGALVRVLVQVAFPPAFVFSDGATYLEMVDSLSPGGNRPVGYGVVLRALSWVTRDVAAVAVFQHLLGLVTAVVLYAALRRWGVSVWPATLASLPVLFDGMQLLLEHSPLSDVVFNLVLLVGLVVLGWWRPPRPAWAAVAGLVLGLSVLVRLVAEPVVLAAALFCLLTGATLRSRLVTAATVSVAFVLPLAAYATWYHSVNGVWALSEAGGRALYMRTTTFVECDRIEVPDYQRVLCPPEPVGDRDDPTDYGWHDERTVWALDPPPGVTFNEATRDFAVAAIRTQPGDYLRVVLRDLWMGFSSWERVDRYDYDTAYKWSFAERVDYDPSDLMSSAYLAHGGDLPRTRHPLGDWLADYGERVYVRGPLLLVMAVLGLAGMLVRSAGAGRGSRALILMTGSVAVGLVLVPDATAEFVWRYQLPALVLLPMSAALGWTRLVGAVRSRRQGPGRRPAPTARTAA